MTRNLFGALSLWLCLAAPAAASTILVDDFEDGALSLVGDGSNPGNVFSHLTNLDPVHTLAGSRTVRISAGVPYSPTLAALSLSAGDDALVFTSGDTGITSDALEIEWSLPQGTLSLAASPSFVVEIDANLGTGRLFAPSLDVFFETVGGVSVAGQFRGLSASGARRYLVEPFSATDELARMNVRLSENEPFSHVYSISEVRLIATPEPALSALLALSGLGLALRRAAARSTR